MFERQIGSEMREERGKREVFKRERETARAREELMELREDCQQLIII